MTFRSQAVQDFERALQPRDMTSSTPCFTSRIFATRSAARRFVRSSSSIVQDTPISAFKRQGRSSRSVLAISRSAENEQADLSERIFVLSLHFSAERAACATRRTPSCDIDAKYGDTAGGVWHGASATAATWAYAETKRVQNQQPTSRLPTIARARRVSCLARGADSSQQRRPGVSGSRAGAGGGGAAGMLDESDNGGETPPITSTMNKRKSENQRRSCSSGAPPIARKRVRSKKRDLPKQ